MKKIKLLQHKIMAALTAGVLVSQSGSAQAQQGVNFTDVTTNLTDSASNLPNLISSVAYISGIGMGVAGIFKLKQHVDNPGNAPMKDGLVRLGAGGGLLSLPYLTEAMMGSVGSGSSTGANISDVTFGSATFK